MEKSEDKKVNKRFWHGDDQGVTRGAVRVVGERRRREELAVCEMSNFGKSESRIVNKCRFGAIQRSYHR